MKIKDLKHNHSLTDLLKVLIFSILMLAPMIAVAVKCAYVVVNKNANQSYYGDTINSETDTLIQFDNLQDNKYYTFKNSITTDKPSVASYTIMFVDNVTNINGFNNNLDLSNCKQIRFYIDSSYNTFFFRDINGNNIAQIGLNNIAMEFKFQFLDYRIDNNNNINGFDYANYFYEISYNKYSFLDNVFYYAIDEMSDNQLFSWTKNTGIYTGVKAMTDNLEITTDVVAVLITYWTLLTVIYVIIDIVLKGFTLLTHMFQKESH